MQLADGTGVSGGFADTEGKLTPAKGKEEGWRDQLPLLQSRRDGDSEEGRTGQ